MEKIKPDLPDRCGRAPLAWACWARQRAAVEMLLERDDVNPDSLDSDGDTPLICALLNGNEEIVRMLLGTGRVDLGRVDASGRPVVDQFLHGSWRQYKAEWLRPILHKDGSGNTAVCL